MTYPFLVSVIIHIEMHAKIELLFLFSSLAHIVLSDVDLSQKEDIEAVIHIDHDHHPRPNPSVKEAFQSHMTKVGHTMQKAMLAGIPLLKKYTSFMKEQECEPVCASGKIISPFVSGCLYNQMLPKSDSPSGNVIPCLLRYLEVRITLAC